MIRPRLLRASCALLALAVTGSCGSGGGDQNRPEVVSTFPVEAQTLAGFPGYVRVVYDERVRVLNDEAVRVNAEGATETVSVPAHLYPDPTNDHAVLVVPAGGGHFEPGALHHVAILEGAVVNDDDHYRLDRFDLTFTVGARPSLFVATDAGVVHEIDPATGAQIATTTPPAGFLAADVTGADGRVFVWLHPGSGSSALGSFVPGAGTIATTHALAGEVGTLVGQALVISRDGRTVYATALDVGSSRILLHRVDVASGLEVGPALVLSPVATPSTPSFRPTVDVTRDRLYVPISDGAGGGRLVVVDLLAWQEVDAGPAAGVDALPMPDGSGPAYYEPLFDYVYVLLSDEGSAGFVVVGPGDFAQFSAREAAFTGTPRVGFPVPDATRFLDGLDGYAGLVGYVQSDSAAINEGFGVEVRDDVGGVLQGSNRVGAILLDPSDWRFFVFSDDGTDTVLTAYDFEERDFFQVDLDDVTPGVQGLSLALSAPGAVLSATTLFGSIPP